MNKKYLWAIVLVIAGILLGACNGTTSSAVSASGNETMQLTAGGAIPPIYNGYPSGLMASGSGTAEADPDIAYINLGIDLRGADPTTIVNDASQRMESILAAVQGAGVAEEDIRTVNYNLWVEQRYDPNTGRSTGETDYHVSHTVRITVRDIEQVGAVLAEAVNAGANNIGAVTFSIEDTDALIAEARRLAIADAQNKAQQMADALGVSLGKVISVSESGGAVPLSYVRAGAESFAVEAPAEVPVPTGSLSVSVNVTVVYELP